MTDEELCKALRWKAGTYAKQAADRIEALVKERDKFRDCFNTNTAILGETGERAEAAKQRVATLEAALKVAVYVIEQLHGAVCGETGFASAVRMVSGIAYPWPSLDAADEDARAFIAKHQVSTKGSQK